MIEKKVFKIVSDVLNIKTVKISINSDKNNLDGWDSVQNLLISSEVESLFDIELSPDEISNFDSVSKILEIVKNKMN